MVVDDEPEVERWRNDGWGENLALSLLQRNSITASESQLWDTGLFWFPQEETSDCWFPQGETSDYFWNSSGKKKWESKTSSMIKAKLGVSGSHFPPSCFHTRSSLNLEEAREFLRVRKRDRIGILIKRENINVKRALVSKICFIFSYKD